MVIVDTNVPITASRTTVAADSRCVVACVKRLADIVRNGGLLVDESGLILREYTRNLGFRGQPGAGHAFVKWAHDHQAIASAVHRVPITPISDAGWRRFAEIPDNGALEQFDRSDQKFVAVAIASNQSPPIVNATDRDWWEYRDVLGAMGVCVEFVCPALMR